MRLNVNFLEAETKLFFFFFFFFFFFWPYLKNCYSILIEIGDSKILLWTILVQNKHDPKS